jgi:TPR repeat protein
MRCRLCAWLCDRFCPPESRSRVRQVSLTWEEGFSSGWEPAEDWEAVTERWAEARRIQDTNPSAALAIYRELADGGSAHSLRMTGWHHEVGQGTEQDIQAAQEFYRRAIAAGSWKATIAYARLSFERGADDEWRRQLEDGVEKGYVPAYFWLARYRLYRSWNKKTAREVQPLLEAAYQAGHPGAQGTLVGLMLFGMFGLRHIPRGIRLFRELLRSRIGKPSEDVSPSTADAAGASARKAA